jgi:hypothetical protein
VSVCPKQVFVSSASSKINREFWRVMSLNVFVAMVYI